VPDEDSVEELPRDVAAPIARAVGGDVSGVRVHRGPDAAEAAERLGARAFTYGRDVYLGGGEHVSDLPLIAHEVAHVVQQDAGRPRVQLFDERRHDNAAALEGEADVIGAAAVRGHRAAVSGRTDGARVQRQSRGQPVRPDPRITSELAFNRILNTEFPGVATGWYSGCRSTSAGAGVTADLAGGRGGRVVFDVGARFATDTQPATLAARTPEVQREVGRVLAWRLLQGILTGADIAIPIVSATLRAMRPLDLRALRGRNAVEPAARDEIARILAITTAVPAAATFQTDGSATHQAGGVTVRILPDVRAGVENETRPTFVPTRVSVPGFSHSAGRITAINGPMPVVPAVEIQTTYAAAGRNAAADPVIATSGYGRGTTPADIAAGDTSLRFHEASHGADFLAYLAAHPYRPFRGTVGMPVVDWRREAQMFMIAHRDWATGLGRFSLCQTDCVGTTIDDFHRGERGYVLQCRTCQH
jgi:Domain of unknown function (DUF4157)